LLYEGMKMRGRFLLAAEKLLVREFVSMSMRLIRGEMWRVWCERVFG
jgi:hypothetical protein